MNWRELYFGHVKASEVQKAIRDSEWQRLRKEMKGRALEEKYEMLCAYRDSKSKCTGEEKRLVEVRITNYVTALSRGGLIKPSDYR